MSQIRKCFSMHPLRLVMEKAQEEQKQLTEREIDLKITPLKNRNGIANKTINLRFDRPLLKIK